MTHMRYWAMTLSAATAGGFIALEKFAFTPNHALWIAFGVAIAAGVFSAAGTGVALMRQNHRFSGLSALSVLIAAFTIIATRGFATTTALWIAFAGGLAILLISLRALALHETTVERVVHSLELNGSGQALADGSAVTVSPLQRLEIPGQMRSWMHWLTFTAVGIAGGFVALTTFAWRIAPSAVQPRWVWFGIGVAAGSIALIALLEHALAARRNGINVSRIAAIAITAVAVAVAAGLIVTMALQSGIDYRWTAFGLGSGMVGVSLVASLIHELSTERVRHELEIAQKATPAPEVAELR